MEIKINDSAIEAAIEEHALKCAKRMVREVVIKELDNSVEKVLRQHVFKELVTGNCKKFVDENIQNIIDYCVKKSTEREFQSLQMQIHCLQKLVNKAIKKEA